MDKYNHSSLHIRQTCFSRSSGIIQFGHRTIPCLLGKNGITSAKREGDCSTPIGRFHILYGFFREDRIRLPRTSIDMMPIKKEFGWCDDPLSRNYNQLIRLPSKDRHELMWREDNLYDVCLVLDYNIFPRRRNLGSAIFFHLMHPDKKPTEGCVAISLEHMKKLLLRCSKTSQLIIHP